MSETSPGHESEPRATSQEIAGMLGLNYGEGAGFDEETLHEIAEQPTEDAFETAFSYLTQAGFDADEALAPWLEPPEAE